jgi:hypothetical protein
VGGFSRLHKWGLHNDEVIMRSILLFAIGVPVPVILLLAFCTHHF